MVGPSHVLALWVNTHSLVLLPSQICYGILRLAYLCFYYIICAVLVTVYLLYMYMYCTVPCGRSFSCP